VCFSSDAGEVVADIVGGCRIAGCLTVRVSQVPREEVKEDDTRVSRVPRPQLLGCSHVSIGHNRATIRTEAVALGLAVDADEAEQSQVPRRGFDPVGVP